jgi:hypothetical protein
MKLVFLLLFLALLGSCKKQNDACLGEELLADVAFQGTLTILTGNVVEIPILHEYIGCEPLTADFCSEIEIYLDSSLVQSILIDVHFRNEYKKIDSIWTVLNEPGDYRFTICPDVKNEVQVRNETSCQ